MLTTYPDSLGNNLKDLLWESREALWDAVGGVHLCHFSHQLVTEGFAPVDYDQVDPAFGDWGRCQTT